MRAVVASVVLAFGAAVTPVLAQAISGHYQFNIPRQPLDAALKDFAQQTGLQIARFSDTVNGSMTVGPITGDLSAEQALASLLAHSGLTYMIVNDRTIAVVVPPEHSGDPGTAESNMSGGSSNESAGARTTAVRLALAQAASAGPDTGAADLPQDQSGQTSPPQHQPPPLLEEVIVTATKQAMPLEKIPEAVTAITGAQLEDLNAQTFEDYFRTVPGLMLNSAGQGLNRFDFSLRGVTSFSTLSAPTNATVGQYVDEIPVTAVGQQIDPRLVDIDRIEVLRGPQGTYFGEDSLGGTLRMITKKPNLDQFSASAESRGSGTEHGGTNDSEAVTVNLPLIKDMLAVRANYFNALDSGFINGVTAACSKTSPTCDVSAVDTRQDNPDRSSGVRGMVLFQPIEQLSVLTEVIHTASVARNAADYNPKVGDLEITQKLPTGAPFGSQADLSSTGTTTSEQNNLYNVTATADLGAVSLVSASSWGYRAVNSATPTTGLGSTTVIPAGVITGLDDFAQELRLVSSRSWSERWDYILGTYYARQSTQSQSYGPQPFTLTSLTHDKAGFGEIGYKFSDHWNARVGLRQQTVDFASSVSPSAGSNTPTTGRVVGNYVFNEDEMLYASVSKGFRQGGLNQYLYHATGEAIPGIPAVYQPDTTTNYELGWKSTFPYHKATLNVALYHIDWKDIQIPGVVSIPGAPGQNQQYFYNAGAAKVDGLEVETGMEFLSGLRGQMSFSLMNPVMTQNQPLPADSPPNYASAWCGRGCPARAGDEIPWDARTSGSLSLNYRHPLAGAFNGFATVSEQYTGTRNTDFASTWEGPSQPDIPTPCPVSTAGSGPPPSGPPGGPPGGPSGPPGGATTCPRTPHGQSNSAFRVIPVTLRTNLEFGIDNGHLHTFLFVDNVFDRRDPIAIIPSNGDPNGDEWLIDKPRTVGVFLRYSID